MILDIEMPVVGPTDLKSQSKLCQFPLILLCTFVFLWPSTTFTSPITQENTTNSDETFKVSDLDFAENLQNPCAFMNSAAPMTFVSSSGAANAIVSMKSKTELLRTTSQELLNTSVLEDCSTLEVPSVAVIPSVEEMKGVAAVEALRTFYTSLLNHTAHVYFILEQLDRHSSDVSCESTGDEVFATKARSLASHMRELMCTVRIVAKSLQDSSDFATSTSQILNEELVNQPLCSRRSVRDCQTAASTATLVNAFCNYLKTATFT